MKALPLLLACLFSAFSASTAVTLIDLQTRNGGFEAADTTPWFGDTQVFHDPVFASQGESCARLQGTGSGTLRKASFQFFDAQPTNGLGFIATFDARNGTAAFDSLHVSFFARKPDLTFIGPTPSSVNFSNLGAASWSTLRARFDLPRLWDTNAVLSLQFFYYKFGAISGTTYAGFIDRVRLEQVIAPSLEIRLVAPAQAVLSWTTNAVDYVLESVSAPGSTNWAPVTAVPAIVVSQYVVTLPATDPQRYFRLREK